MKALENFSTNESNFTVSADVSSTDLEYVIRFEVHNKREDGWNTQPQFGTDPRKNWELWNTDVVECFLRPEGPQFKDGRYLELQLSPAGQGLILWIVRPRQCYFTPLVDHQLVRFESHQTSGHFEGIFYINKKLFGPITSISGNLHACLGTGEREYWGLHFVDRVRLDFHRPEGFVKLL